MEKWELDKRAGCLAVYPESEDHNCLEGAREWAIHYAYGTCDEKEGWSISQEKINNARLIAAAPELFEALESVIYAHDKVKDLKSNTLSGGDCIAIVKARAAIAKAKEK